MKVEENEGEVTSSPSLAVAAAWAEERRGGGRGGGLLPPRGHEGEVTSSPSLTVATARGPRREGRDIWVTHLHADNAVFLGGHKETDFPERFALVIGAEHEGVSPAMLEASSKAVYLSMVGFVESLNVGVATALALQRILDLCPSMRGDVSVGEQLAMRSAFYRRLARNKTQARVFGQRAAVLNREAVLGGGQGGAEGTSM